MSGLDVERIGIRDDRLFHLWQRVVVVIIIIVVVIIIIRIIIIIINIIISITWGIDSPVNVASLT